MVFDRVESIFALQVSVFVKGDVGANAREVVNGSKIVLHIVRVCSCSLECCENKLCGIVCGCGALSDGPAIPGFIFIVFDEFRVCLVVDFGHDDAIRKRPKGLEKVRAVCAVGHQNGTVYSKFVDLFDC